ncbi:DUF6685 family protein [Ectothiorhodospira variabilis]|uniref:DUF6685 family protein n=1 Tax=Ectothiorhodospira variabilis TaxID=505694 RepID=UPI001EFB9F43|nr:DUF6685 family protein [Ectothiorhodospira variabilis]MCG5495556.1 hypothetical protein [Ectothiorhodospira variabilis]MCG5505164.1 hypothetical protein [Ectothiorhodospira variabilis]MCG5508321.1 hypothetical protein [Ectothiorhodospira variabilis]
MMNASSNHLGRVVTYLREDLLAQPVRLRRALTDQPNLVNSCPALLGRHEESGVGLDSVMQWHRWNPQDLSWPARQRLDVGYRHAPRHIPELRALCKETEIPEWSCDIQEVEGIAASKSKLEGASDLDAWVESRASHLIEDISEEGLAAVLSHDQIRILNSPRHSDYFQKHTWDGRVFWVNDGGSHHFAAARYIASRIGQPVRLTALLKTYSIDPDVVSSLREQYEVFAIEEDEERRLAVQSALESVGAAYCWGQLPPPCAEQAFVVLLPKNDRRARRAAQVMRETGTFDLGAHLSELSATS